ncbi:hypothetical protein ZEAMMB73_Zm00001d011564 [Zea mays]|uniref:Uncharacterized protein n=1 Tax=Zea mays TaxID=4577 RepID=A0A1D6G1D4_MAIZE|nr:hypothetical protein ZEAMMB73_Zm00001d011564 [Zea mays]AQK97236.1 hypothetical protein ZEAMMB73_Zm00001d011564 [Zea mays]
MLAVIPASARPTSTNLFCRCPSRPSSSIPCLRRGRPSLAATRGLLQASAQGGAVAHGVRLHAPCNPPHRVGTLPVFVSSRWCSSLPPSLPRGLLPPHGVDLDRRRLKPPRLATATPPAVWIRSWGGRPATARSNGGADLAVFEQFERMVYAWSQGVNHAIIRHNQPEVWAFCLGNGYAGLKDALGSNDSRLQSSKLYFTCMSLAGMLLQ